MSDKPHVVNNIYSIILIACALLGFGLRYLQVGDVQYTALTPAVIGLILLPMSKGIKNENKVIAHVAVVLVLVVMIMLGKMFISSLIADVIVWRKAVLFGIMTGSSVWAMKQYVKGFIAKKKARNNQ
jgi:protein-S-isoprenylcysteine O-methyltransferase Ste14